MNSLHRTIITAFTVAVIAVVAVCWIASQKPAPCEAYTECAKWRAEASECKELLDWLKLVHAPGTEKSWDLFRPQPLADVTGETP